MDLCQQGEWHRVGILTLDYFQWTISRRWPTNVYCNAEQICPKPRFEHVCAVCCCVWGPALCKRGVHKHCCLKVSAFAVGWCRCCLFPVAPARFPCVFFSVVFACGGGLLGLGEGHQAFKSTKIAHTSWRISFFILCIQCIDIFLGEHHFSPSSPWHSLPGFL